MNHKQVLHDLNKSSNYVEIQLPNEIFNDFMIDDFENFNHKCFAYSYYYLISFLYRNALYGTAEAEKYSQNNIIKMFVSNKSTVSYVTKKGGILDRIGYTETTTDYPVSYYVDNGILEFELVKSLRKKAKISELNHSPRLSIKKPIKAFIRYEDEDFSGTFYSFSNTHKISIDRFFNIINDKKLGHVGLYVYGFIKMMCDRHSNGYQVSNANIGSIVGCSDRTVQNYTQRLEAVGLIESGRKTKDNKLYEKVYRIKSSS